jgi:DNA-binding response OmpR family regulator
MRVLVVDDEPALLGWLATHLTAWGHEPVPAASGREALALLDGESFPLVMTDWMMPGMDGLALVRAIRARPPAPGYTYVMMATAKGGRASYLEALDAGADDFIQKPIDADVLVARIRVVERWQAVQRELAQLRGLLPICSYCKNIRDERESWRRVEEYVAKHSDAQFTHTVCPACVERYLKPQMAALFPGEGEGER